MFFTVGSAIVGLFGKSVTPKVAKILGISAFVLVAVAVIAIFFAVHDRNIRNDVLDDQDLVVANSVISADRIAAENKTVRDNDFSNSQAAVNSAIDTAIAKAPEETRKSVGPASQSYYDELRRQKGKAK